jgi:hypothetical protein
MGGLRRKPYCHNVNMAIRIFYRCDPYKFFTGGYVRGNPLTIVEVINERTFRLSAPHGYIAGMGVLKIGKQLLREPLASAIFDRIELKNPITPTPTVGTVVYEWNGELTQWRGHLGAVEPLSFTADADGNGFSGRVLNAPIKITDINGNCPIIECEYPITIMDGTSTVVWSGKIYAVDQQLVGKLPDGSDMMQYQLTCKGWADVADELGLEEPPLFNVNAGKLLQRLVTQYTTLTPGTIDTVNSPTLDVVRIGNYKRLTELGKQLQALWPGSVFSITPGQMTGIVNFQLRQDTQAPIQLTTDFVEQLGPGNCTIQLDTSKTYNIVRFPFWLEKWRSPDRFTQVTTADDAFLKSTVVLSGQPSSVDLAFLVSDDFSDGQIDDDFVEDDLTNPSPPSGFIPSDGYLLEGVLNTVTGLHLLPSPGEWGDIGRVTDPAVIVPWSGDERQMIMLKELVINTLGDALFMGLSDPTSYVTAVTTVTSVSVFDVASVDGLTIGDKITVDGEDTFISGISGLQITVSPALSTLPQPTDVVSLHRLALSRIKFAVYLKTDGSINLMINGAETPLSPARTYTAAATYSFRLMAMGYETHATGGTSATGCTLNSATGFATGDVVELFTSGERSAPVQRVVTVSGSDITYTATNETIKAGYRVKTLPKLVLQIKGGAYSSITGREWVTIWTSPNTWQTSPATKPAKRSIVLCMGKTLAATVTEFYAKNPPPVTGFIGNRYLHIASQDVESSEPDIDCIIRKVGSHYQLDFFPDTKALWSSGSVLTLFYKERERHDLEDSDTEAMRKIVAMEDVDGVGIDTLNDKELRRRSGKTLTTVELLPEPISINDAISQAREILNAAKNPQVRVEFNINDEQYGIVKPGQLLQSTYPGIESPLIQRVVYTESVGQAGRFNRQAWVQSITAGTLDRLGDVLVTRRIKNGSRTVIDDGVNDDSYTRITKGNFSDTISFSELFKLTDGNPTTLMTKSDGTYNNMGFIRVF